MTPKELIEWLDNEIETEMQKPTEEIDMEFVNECEQLIDILMDNYHEYTDEDAEKFFAELEKKKNAKKTNVFMRSKKILAASIAILIIFLGGFTIYASSPVVREYFREVLNFNIGESFTRDGFTYTHAGKTNVYTDIDELIENEALDIKYPKYLPYNSTIEKIGYIENDKTIYFTFSNIAVAYTIQFKTPLLEGHVKYAEKITVNNIDFYLNEKSTSIVAYSNINGDLYTLQCPTKEELIKMINSIE